MQESTTMSQSYFVADGEDHLEYQIKEQEDGTLAITLPSGEQLNVSAYQPEPQRVNLVVEGSGEAHDVGVRTLDGTLYEVEIQAQRHSVDVVNARQKRMLAAGVGTRKAGGPELVSPMAGKVVAIESNVGDAVDVGQCVLIVEAMKMENDLKAHIAGQVVEILVTPGQAVEIGDVLARIEAAE